MEPVEKPKWKNDMENLVIGSAFETDAKNYNTMRSMRSVLRKNGFDFQFKLGKGTLTVRRTA